MALFQAMEVLPLFKPEPRSGAPTRAMTRIPLERVETGPDRPRQAIPESSVAALAESIRLHGQLSPILVRPLPSGRYRLIAGERRLRALRRLNRAGVDAVILPDDDCECALIALVENLHREPLHYLDVAAACRRLLDTYPITQERLAASLACSPSALANRLRLLKLPARVRTALRELGLSERHARALLKLPDEADQLALATLAGERELTVSQLERCVEQRLNARPRPEAKLGDLVRDNRLVINALMDTVRQLARIGVPVRSRVEERADAVEIIVTIPASPDSARRAASV